MSVTCCSKVEISVVSCHMIVNAYQTHYKTGTVENKSLSRTLMYFQPYLKRSVVLMLYVCSSSHNASRCPARQKVALTCRGRWLGGVILFSKTVWTRVTVDVSVSQQVKATGDQIKLLTFSKNISLFPFNCTKDQNKMKLLLRIFDIETLRSAQL